MYEMNEELDLKNQVMLPETKAILFNLFRDYLSTPEQKEKIKKMQAEDRRKLEEQKKQEFGEVEIFKTEVQEEKIVEDKCPVIVKKENIFTRILKSIKHFFNKLIK